MTPVLPCLSSHGDSHWLKHNMEVCAWSVYDTVEDRDNLFLENIFHSWVLINVCEGSIGVVHPGPLNSTSIISKTARCDKNVIL